MRDEIEEIISFCIDTNVEKVCSVRSVTDKILKVVEMDRISGHNQVNKEARDILKEMVETYKYIAKYPSEALDYALKCVNISENILDYVKICSECRGSGKIQKTVKEGACIYSKGIECSNCKGKGIIINGNK